MRRPTHGSTRIGLIPSERAFQTMDESHIAWSLLWLVAFAIIPSGGLPEVSAYVTSVPHMLFDSLVVLLLWLGQTGLTYSLLRGSFQQQITVEAVYQPYAWASIPWILASLITWLIIYVAPDTRTIAQVSTQLTACIYSFSWILHALHRHVTLSYWQIAGIILIPFTFVYIPFFCLALLIWPR